MSWQCFPVSVKWSFIFLSWAGVTDANRKLSGSEAWEMRGTFFHAETGPGKSSPCVLIDAFQEESPATM